MNIAKAIADLRSERGISQEDLSNTLNVSRDLISKWETGVRRPDWQMIERIANAFDVLPSVIVDKNALVFTELEKCLLENMHLSISELVPILNLFLYNLKEDEADIFIQRYYFLESIADIAISFHRKENHIRSILSRTRKKLSKHIKEVSIG